MKNRASGIKLVNSSDCTLKENNASNHVDGRPVK
jgi:parallel beta-helix repeat protein